MNRAHALWLAAASILLVVLGLEPLSTFPLFGSDTGEYYRLTAALVTTGHLPTGSAYGGWGFAYADFPGIFLLSGATGSALGVDALAALQLAVPAVAALSVVPLYLLFRRLVSNDTVALFGAALAGVAMPRAFSIAHPAPLALGDFLVVAGLWMFVEGRRDRRWYLPLALSSGALIVTHHLSSYFFLLSALGGFLLLELLRPGVWSRRFPLREFLFLGAFALGLLAYWFGYATSFRTIVPQGLPLLGGEPVLALEAAAIVSFIVLGLLVRTRRQQRAPAGFRFRFPSDRSVLRDALLLVSLTVVPISFLLFVPLPGTTQFASAPGLAFFTPVFLLAPLAAGSRRLVTSSRIGPFAFTWLGVLGLSATFGLATTNPVILPDRHVEYILIPVGLLVALAAGRLVARWGDKAGRRALVAASVGAVVLLAANAAIVYPPPAFFGGFQEGLTGPDAQVWAWVGIALPPSAVVASDHRLSSMIFGFDGNPATWDSTPDLFVGSNYTRALADLHASFAPHGTPRPIDAVAVDGVMYHGVALNPSDPAEPLSAAAKGWLAAPPFVPLYESGPAVVYWVAGPIPG